VSGIHTEVAHRLLEPLAALQRATTALSNTVERLCDPELGNCLRAESTARLYSEAEDARCALAAMGDVVLADGLMAEDTTPNVPGEVVVVSATRWRRHGWGRTR